MTITQSNDPIYSRATEPHFEQDSYNDLLFNSDGKGFMSHISYESFEYDGAIRIVKLEVETNLTDKYLLDGVLENLKFRNNGKNIVMECKMILK